MSTIVFEPYVDADDVHSSIVGQLQSPFGRSSELANKSIVGRIGSSAGKLIGHSPSKVRGFLAPTRGRSGAAYGVIGYMAPITGNASDATVTPNLKLIVGYMGTPLVSASGHHLAIGSIAGNIRPPRGRISDVVPRGVVGSVAPFSGYAKAPVAYTGGMLILQSPGYLYLSRIVGAPDIYLIDHLLVSDSMKSALRVVIKDSLKMSDSIGTSATLSFLLSDVLKLDGKLLILFNETISDVMTFSDSVSVRLNLAALIDALVMSDIVSTKLDAKQVIASILSFKEILDEKLLLDLIDELVLDDYIDGKLDSNVALVDILSLSDDLSGTGSFSVTLADNIELSGSVSTRLNTIFKFADSIKFACQIATDDGVYIAYAMNTTNAAVSTYDNFGFNSFAEIDGVLFGASDAGLCTLGGNDDAGENINASIETGLDNYSSTAYKRMAKGYLHFRSDGAMLISVTTTSPQGVRFTETYRANPLQAEDFRETNVDIGKGLNSVKWKFTISNENGSDFDLDALYVIPIICGKRSNG